MAINAPRTNGVIFCTKIELVGLLPVKTLNGTMSFTSSKDLPAFTNSASTSSLVLPNASASVCAKKFDNNLL